MELSVTSEETFEDEAVNGVIIDSCSASDEVVLQLTVDDDSDVVCSSSSRVANDSVTTKSIRRTTGCSANMRSSSLVQNSRDRRLRKRKVSDVAVAQAKVFRQYLLDGNLQARILELDHASKRGVCLCSV